MNFYYPRIEGSVIDMAALLLLTLIFVKKKKKKTVAIDDEDENLKRAGGRHDGIIHISVTASQSEL